MKRLHAWWLSRLPRQDTHTLGQRTIYILPTRAGWVFGLTLLTMLIASINFQLSLGYVLTFLLAGAGVVSMHITHNNLRGLTLHLRPPQPGFARCAVPIEIVVTAPQGARHGLGMCFDGQQRNGTELMFAFDVPAGGQSNATLSVTPPTRGVHAIDPIHLESRFPFGLFRAWTTWRVASSVLAWPTPEHSAPAWPETAHATNEGQRVSSLRDGGEWEGVRAWRRGDPMKRLVWKKIARSGELVSRDTSSVESREIWFDWQHTVGAPAADVEARLSRLTAWILQAHELELPHGLRMPGVQLEPDLGDAHRRRTLDTLAGWS
jgi:uncharacterized protein (DUF58 family)